MCNAMYHLLPHCFHYLVLIFLNHVSHASLVCTSRAKSSHQKTLDIYLLIVHLAAAISVIITLMTIIQYSY